MLAAVVLTVAAAVLVTAFGTRPAGAAFPGENGKIVYEDLDLKTFNYEIFVMNHDGTGKTRLTYNAAEDRMPAVSPNGTKIAFASNRDGAGPLINSIYVMGIDSSDLTRPTKDSGTSDFYPSWSPQGATPEQVRDFLVVSTPLGRLVAPADVAAAVLFYASDLSGFVTGTSLALDGGAHRAIA